MSGACAPRSPAPSEGPCLAEQLTLTRTRARGPARGAANAEAPARAVRGRGALRASGPRARRLAYSFTPTTAVAKLRSLKAL